MELHMSLGRTSLIASYKHTHMEEAYLTEYQMRKALHSNTMRVGKLYSSKDFYYSTITKYT